METKPEETKPAAKPSFFDNKIVKLVIIGIIILIVVYMLYSMH
jgi:hypothetical protein